LTEVAEHIPSNISASEPLPGRNSIARVFECERDGQRVYSDQRCGSDAAVREIDAPNRMDAQDTSGLYDPVVEPPRSHTGSSSESASSAAIKLCESIDQQIDLINARMRQGYGSWQGERFRNRLRELSRQRYEAKCIR
jgi:hypothetical protein